MLFFAEVKGIREGEGNWEFSQISEMAADERNVRNEILNAFQIGIFLPKPPENLKKQ